MRAVQRSPAARRSSRPALASRLATELGPAPRTRPADTALPELTAREGEILQLVARHVTHPGIAVRLGLTPKTVPDRISNIFAKLQVADRAQAITVARNAGLS